MRLIGAKRPAEIRHDYGNGSNADLVFENDNTIAEIKTLMEDLKGKDTFKEKIYNLYSKWTDDGKVNPIFGTVLIKTEDLPDECAREFIQAFNTNLTSVVKKANNQIKKTKERLGMHDARGLLIICNSGNISLRPDVLLYGLADALRNRNTSIHWLIYMTYGLPVKLPNMPCAADLFTFPVREGYDPMPESLSKGIREAWMRHISKGGLVAEYEASDHTSLFGVEHQAATFK